MKPDSFFETSTSPNWDALFPGEWRGYSDIDLFSASIRPNANRKYVLLLALGGLLLIFGNLGWLGMSHRFGVLKENLIVWGIILGICCVGASIFVSFVGQSKVLLLLPWEGNLYLEVGGGKSSIRLEFPFFLDFYVQKMIHSSKGKPAEEFRLLMIAWQNDEPVFAVQEFLAPEDLPPSNWKEFDMQMAEHIPVFRGHKGGGLDLVELRKYWQAIARVARRGR